MSAGEALAACPFCGGLSVLDRTGTGRIIPSCRDQKDECLGFNSFYSFATEREAIAAWNQRVPTTSAGVPQGMVLVPVEPTLEMTDAGEDAIIYHPHDVIRNQADPVWSAMIAVAPSIPSQADDSADKRCSICGGLSFVAVDVRQFNGEYAAGPERRCVECKTTFTAQAFAALQPKASDSGRDDGGAAK